MNARPSLTRSIPFWVLVVGSLASIGYGAWLLTDRLGVMTATLTDGTATGLEVYVGQSLATFGGTLVAAGVVGVLIALAVATIAGLRPAAIVEIVEPIDWADEETTAFETPEAASAAPAFDAAPAAPASEPAVHTEPAVQTDPAPESENTTR